MRFKLFQKRPGTALENRTAWLQLDDYSAYPIAGPCTIGRAKTNTVPIPCEKVSRLHALVQIQEGTEHWLVDLGSSNGTYLNGRRVVQPCRLEDKDVIQIGEHSIQFLLRAAAEPANEEEALAQAQLTIRETQEAPCWLLVADIENFVTHSEQMDADRLARAVGEWLAACNQLIQKHQGAISRYLGDGFVAYWDGRRVPPGEVADCLDAIKKLQKSAQLPFRVAVHFGKAEIGGSAVMGDAGLFGRDVNFAFRMEKLAQSLSASCLLSEAAYDAFSRPAVARNIGRHSVRGFEEKFLFYGVE